jgi:hypothetical protein
MPTITLEEDAPPIVRVLGVTLRRAAAQPALARTLDGMNGVVALRSTSDPQAATIRFDHGAVHVTRGVHPEADIVIRADLNTMGRPGAAKPKVKGAAAHPRLALAVAKVLDPPVEGGWQAAAEDFWNWSAGRRGRPARLTVICTDDGAMRTFGAVGDPNVPGCELHGPAWVLTSVFTGGDHLAAALLEGRLHAVADMPTISALVGVVSARMLGDD